MTHHLSEENAAVAAIGDMLAPAFDAVALAQPNDQALAAIGEHVDMLAALDPLWRAWAMR